MGASRRLTSTWVTVATLTAIGAAVRFVGLDRQSFWIDEVITVELLAKSLPDMLGTLPDAESTPPLYYVLAWLWSRVAGHRRARAALPVGALRNAHDSRLLRGRPHARVATG